MIKTMSELLEFNLLQVYLNLNWFQWFIVLSIIWY